MKKILLGLGTMTMSAAPIAMIISCGTDEKSIRNTSNFAENIESNNQFKGDFSLLSKEIEFKKSIFYINDETFKSESSLEEITLPNVKQIGSKAFSLCYKLTSVNAASVEKIWNQAFYNVQLTSISIPEVKIIEDYAFNSAQLTSLSLPQVAQVGNNSFSSSKLTSLSLPKITKIGDDAFNNAQLTSLSLPQVAQVGKHAFRLSKLTSLSMPKAKTIGDSAFFSSPLTSISLPETKIIGLSAFQKSELTSLYLPKAEEIADGTFKLVNSPDTKVTLPKKFISSSEEERIFGKGTDKVTFIPV